MKTNVKCETVLRWITFGLCFLSAHTQCIFQPPFNNSVWYDNTKGTLTFGTHYMSGWYFYPFSQTIYRWQCVNNAVDNYLIMRSRFRFRYTRASGSVDHVYGYLCLQLTNVTDTSYIYYQKQVQINDIGGERMKLSTLGTLDYADVCSDTVNVPPSEFHVLVKRGSEAASAITCPNSLLFTGDYTYQHNDTSAPSCDTSADVMDVCSNTSEVIFNYTTCSQKIAYSAGGILLCVAYINSGGYDYVTLLNRDSTFTTDTKRFSCMSTDGNHASVAIGNCTATQTPYRSPTMSDGTTVIGHLLMFTSKYNSCGTADVLIESDGLTGGEIAAIVVCTLLLFLFISGSIICIVACLFTAKIFLIIIGNLSVVEEKVKLPVTLPDIAAQLQELKLNQESLVNGGPMNDKEKFTPAKIHFDGRGKSISPPLTTSNDKPLTPRYVTILKKDKLVAEDKTIKLLNTVESGVGDKHVKTEMKMQNEVSSSGKDSKDIIKDNYVNVGQSPRKLGEIKPVGKSGKADLSPRKVGASETILQAKSNLSPCKGGQLEAPQKTEHSPRKEGKLDISPKTSRKTDFSPRKKSQTVPSPRK